MSTIRLTRIASCNGATLGALSIDNWPRLVTLEDAWLENASNVSCIPNGSYTIKRHQSPKFGEVFKVELVPNRSHILLHWGNTDIDTHGCILLGTSFGELNGKPAILQSKAAFCTFMHLLQGKDSAKLDIIQVYDR